MLPSRCRWSKHSVDKPVTWPDKHWWHCKSVKRLSLKKLGARRHMLGSVCHRLSVSGRTSCPSSLVFPKPSQSNSFHNLQAVKVALPQSPPSSPHAHSYKHITCSTGTGSLPHTIRRSRASARPDKSQQNTFSPLAMDNYGPVLPMKSFPHHSSTCLLAANGNIGATIWHALLPARHFAVVDCEATLLSRRALPGPSIMEGSAGKSAVEPAAASVTAVKSGAEPLSYSLGGLRAGMLAFESVGMAKLGSVNGSLTMATGLREGSWNVAWDARPARWLHGRHSAWLLFGVCACFSAAATASVPLIATTTSSPALAEALSDGMPDPLALPEPESQPVEPQVSHGKQVHTNYTVTGIPGDGRCLFRAVAHGASLRSGKAAPNESLQRELADELRNRVVDELIKRRDTIEWFIEGDFDTYVKRMRQTHVWGGEPELLMLSHVLEMPITVYMSEQKTDGGLIAIAEYGQEYGRDDPVRVLYHGFGHYEALQIPKENFPSKL